MGKELFELMKYVRRVWKKASTINSLSFLRDLKIDYGISYSMNYYHNHSKSLLKASLNAHAGRDIV